MLVIGLFLLNGALLAGCQPEGSREVGSLENVTVHVIDSKTVQVFWATTWKNVERYDVTYNPAEDRIVTQAAGNSNSVVLRELRPNTQYQVTVSAVINGKNYKSRRFVFKTANGTGQLGLETVDSAGPGPTKPTRGSKWRSTTVEIVNPDPTAIGSKYTPQTSTTVRGVEIGLVLLALVVWIIAISLFFHRWGKIRMLLPYQPDYKTQQSLKVPGTGTSSSGRTGNGATQAQQEGPGCVQHLRWSFRHLDERSAATKFPPSKWSSRSRVSSAIFPASPSFYARSSLECESARVIRQVHSHNDLSAEAIPLCEMSQPVRGESPVGVLTGRTPKDDVASNRRPEKNLFLEREPFKKSKETKDSYFVLNKDYLSVHRARDSPARRLDPDSELKVMQEGNETEFEPLFFVEAGSFHLRDSGGESTVRREQQAAESKRAKRYTRSSFKKQKMRYYEDCEPASKKIVPTLVPSTLEQVENVSQTNFSVKGDRADNPKEEKTAEIKRKTFLRKISLQDTHLNYNQDYWLDHRKSGHFHKSIDLGYLSKETGGQAPNRKQESTGDRRGVLLAAKFEQRTNRSGSLSPSKWPPDDPAKCDSDPLLFSKERPNASLDPFDMNSSELLTEVISRCREKAKFVRDPGSWLLPNSNDNIPLFSNRTGLIETEFEVLDERPTSHPPSRDAASDPPTLDVPTSDDGHPNFTLPFDLSTFYEVKLRESGQGSDDECAQGRLPPSSGSDDWIAFNETEPSAVFNRIGYPLGAYASSFSKSTYN